MGHLGEQALLQGQEVAFEQFRPENTPYLPSIILGRTNSREVPTLPPRHPAALSPRATKGDTARQIQHRRLRETAAIAVNAAMGDGRWGLYKPAGRICVVYTPTDSRIVRTSR